MLEPAVIKAEPAAPVQWSAQFPFDSAAGYRRMPLEILRHFHVIDWTKWTGA